MQNNFEANEIKNAKSILDKDLKMATHSYKIHKEQQKAMSEKRTFWMKIKGLVRKLF